MTYHAMRMRWCGLALVAFLRRWGLHLLVFALVLGAGSNASREAPAAAAAWLVLPLFYAIGEPRWLALAWPLQALVGAAAIWGLRSLLWPQAWAEQERSLPLRRRDTVLSDAIAVAIALLPLMLVCALGAVTLLASNPAWLHGQRFAAVGALGTALVASVGLGVGVLQGLRRAPSGRRRRGVSACSGQGLATPLGERLGWWRALLWLPLWRGPAARTRRALGWGSIVLCLPGLGAVLQGGDSGWWLAAFALASLIIVSRLNTLTRADYGPLWEACAPLPLAMPPLWRARTALVMLPLAPGWLALLAGLPFAGLRWGVGAAYAAAHLIVCTVEANSKPGDARAKASRWLLSLVLMVALASEVMA